MVSCKNGFCCFAETYTEERAPKGYSTGENSAASCILLPKGSGTGSCQDVQMRGEQDCKFRECDNLITMVIRINFKFRKLRAHTHSWVLCKLTSAGVKETSCKETAQKFKPFYFLHPPQPVSSQKQAIQWAEPVINYLERLNLGQWARTQTQTLLSWRTSPGQIPRPGVATWLEIISQ